MTTAYGRGHEAMLCSVRLSVCLSHVPSAQHDGCRYNRMLAKIRTYVRPIEEKKPSPALLQNHSPGGCTIDMPPSNCHRRRHIVSAARFIYFFIHAFQFAVCSLYGSKWSWSYNLLKCASISLDKSGFYKQQTSSTQQQQQRQRQRRRRRSDLHQFHRECMARKLHWIRFFSLRFVVVVVGGVDCLFTGLTADI